MINLNFLWLQLWKMQIRRKKKVGRVLSERRNDAEAIFEKGGGALSYLVISCTKISFLCAGQIAIDAENAKKRGLPPIIYFAFSAAT